MRRVRRQRLRRCAGACQGVSSSLKRRTEIMKIAVLERESDGLVRRETGAPAAAPRAPQKVAPPAQRGDAAGSVYDAARAG